MCKLGFEISVTVAANRNLPFISWRRAWRVDRKRDMKGVYQHCHEKHLHRYVGEIDFRNSNRAALGVDDMERAEKMAKDIVGKRLTNRRPVEADFKRQAKRFLRRRSKALELGIRAPNRPL
jgi:hypothetical protein